jgi:Flp pilus assembly protein TadB
VSVDKSNRRRRRRRRAVFSHQFIAPPQLALLNHRYAHVEAILAVAGRYRGGARLASCVLLIVVVVVECVVVVVLLMLLKALRPLAVALALLFLLPPLVATADGLRLLFHALPGA